MGSGPPKLNSAIRHAWPDRAKTPFPCDPGRVKSFSIARCAVDKESISARELLARFNELAGAGGAESIDVLYVRMSHAGDPLATQTLAKQVLAKVAREMPLSVPEKYWLSGTLMRLAADEDAAKLHRATTRGAPRKYAKGHLVAVAVVHQVLEGGAATMEEAFQKVAAAEFLGEDSVKTYWRKWKPGLVEIWGADDLPQVLERALAQNRNGELS